MKKNTPLFEQLLNTSQKCTDCGLCQKECSFLQKHGSPLKIATSCLSGLNMDQKSAFECSLCGLCSAVCPAGVNPVSMFSEMRNNAFQDGVIDLSDFKGILFYERIGSSKPFSWYGLPEGCDTVFFPGCSLPGTRPETTFKIFGHLKHDIPDLGIVLDCCTKPSLSLGRMDLFRDKFMELRDFLVDNGIKKVLVACPNCYNVFKKYGGELSVKTVYESLADSRAPGIGSVSGGTVTVHDPCVMRFEPHVHDAVRGLIKTAGFNIREMSHAKDKTLCCGEGGAVGCIAPELSGNWTRQRVREAGEDRIITYCAGCTGILSKDTPADHLADLFFDPEKVDMGKADISRGPLTYLNRIRLKKRFRKNVPVSVERTRPSLNHNDNKDSLKKHAGKVIILALMAIAVVAIKNSNAGQALDPDSLRQWIDGYGMMAPVIYMIVYSISPALFLPGLPLTIMGGVLFGPFWGVVYAITGATSGACISFLISRYVARGWIESRLVNPRWKKLDHEVEKNGWKVVAMTRLIPLFPFNLLNYAFGLTKISFWQYAGATFICMLPACIGFIVFSSSLTDLFKGKVSAALLAGLALIAMVSILPAIFRKYKAKSNSIL